jgi:hypothetical protein
LSTNKNYKITFKNNRVGRNKDVKPLELSATSLGELQEALHYFCGQHLISSFFDVVINPSDMTGSIEYGRYGDFIIKELK